MSKMKNDDTLISKEIMDSEKKWKQKQVADTVLSLNSLLRSETSVKHMRFSYSNNHFQISVKQLKVYCRVQSHCSLL